MKVMGACLAILFSVPSFAQFDSTELITITNNIKYLQAKTTSCDSFMQETDRLLTNYRLEHTTTTALLAKDSLVIANYEKERLLNDKKEKEYIRAIENLTPSWLSRIFNSPVSGFVLGFIGAYFIFK